MSIRRFVSGAAADRRGAVAIIIALTVPILLGGMAISVDTVYWRARSQYLQAAADAAAASAVIDLNTGVVGAPATARIVANATIEARRMCSDCAVTVNYPYQSDVNRVRVQLRDARASRFFSFLFDRSQVTLQSAAVAVRGGAPTAPASGSGCILTLATSGDGIFLQSNTGGIGPSNCEVVSNSTSASSVLVMGITSISSPVTTAGGTTIYAPGTITGTPVKTYQPAVPDPYATRMSSFRSTVARNAYTDTGPFACSGMWKLPNINQRPELNGDGQTGNPAHNTSGNVPEPGNAYSRMNNGQFQWDASARTWRFTSSQANFCTGAIFQNTTITFGPGTYIFGADTILNNVTLYGNGATFVLGPGMNNWQMNGFGAGVNVRMTAPPSTAPSDMSQGIPGLVWTQFSDDTTERDIWFANGVTMKIRGAIYLPSRNVRINQGGSMGPTSIDDGEQCTHIVVKRLYVYFGVQVANGCTAPTGVAAFGTAPGPSNPSASGGLRLVE